MNGAFHPSQNQPYKSFSNSGPSHNLKIHRSKNFIVFGGSKQACSKSWSPCKINHAINKYNYIINYMYDFMSLDSPIDRTNISSRVPRLQPRR